MLHLKHRLAPGVRQRIGALIIQGLVPVKMPLPVITLDGELEAMLAQAMRVAGDARHPIEPSLANRIVEQVVNAARPMLGQAHHFRLYAPEQIEYAVNRYSNEARRLYQVMDKQLGQHAYLAGENYTIADIACASILQRCAAFDIGRPAMPNLERWVAEQVLEKDIVIYDGACPMHDVLRAASVERTRGEFPEAGIVAHPECRQDLVEIADEVCSNMGMLDAVEKYLGAKTFIVATENGMLHQLKARFPDREFVAADGCIGCRLHCPYMKVTGLQDLYFSLAEDRFEILLENDVIEGAQSSLERMMAVPRDH